MSRNRKTISINKIEVDEHTSEPKIVNIVAENDSVAGESKREKDSVAEEHKQISVGKQLVMTRILGIQELDKNVDRRQKILKRTVTAVFLILVVGVLAYTFYADFFASPHEPISWIRIRDTFSSTWFYLVFALLSLFLSYLFKGLKLSVICKSQTKKWHFKTCFETGVIGHYYNYVTPLAIGGQPFEIYHLSKHGVHGGVAASMPIITFFMYQLTFVVTGIASLILLNSNVLNIPQNFLDQFPAVFNILAVIGLICCIGMPSLVVVFSMLPRLGARLVKIGTTVGGKLHILKNPKKTEFKTLKTIVHNARSIKRFTKSPLAFVANILLSVGEVAALCSIAFFTLKLFGYENPDPEVSVFKEWLYIVQLCVILYAAISFIPTPGNSGAADLSFYMLFTVGVGTAGFSFVAMVVWRVLSYYSYIIIGFIFTTTNRKKDRIAEFLGVSDLDK